MLSKHRNWPTHQNPQQRVSQQSHPCSHLRLTLGLPVNSLSLPRSFLILEALLQLLPLLLFRGEGLLQLLLLPYTSLVLLLGLHNLNTK